MSVDTSRHEPIAIVGMACRFPRAENPREFWTLLRGGEDAIVEVPADRWDVDAFFDADPAVPGKMNSRWGGFLAHVDQFDPDFFGISPREAISMDPQQRLLLELAWEALEDAALVPKDLAGTATGVFVGISTNDYGHIEPRDPRTITPYWSTGNALNVAAGRISYCFDFQGPAVAIDTACSASLVAIHCACTSLRAGESELALAGGVNLILSPVPMINFTKAGALARDGRCKVFDARADGIVRGEGAGLIVLKPLARAIADRDPIHAVILGSAVNQDGRSNGLTAPNRHAQEALLRAAYRSAGIAPSSVQYVDAHGTGTLLGDPIELKALGHVLGPGRRPDRACAVGSVKSNIGHLESAAGIASLLKVVLSLEHGELPPSLHFHEPNPHVPFDKLGLVVQQTLGPWRSDQGPRIAGVSSFGFAGTNAHVVLEEAPAAPPDAAGTQPAAARAHLLPLSAQTAEALDALVRSWVRWLEHDDSSVPPAAEDLCYTASLRRTHHAHRLAVAFESREDLVAGLHAFLKGRERPAVHFGSSQNPQHDPRVVFVFSGQGVGWWGVNVAFIQREPVVRRVLEQCDELLRPLAGWSLLDEFAARDRIPLEEMELLQPAVFAFQVALAELWRSWDIRPDAIVGHSMGEVAAAHVAGALSLEDALQVVYHRGRLMQEGLRTSHERGAMAAVRLPLDQARRLVAELGGDIAIAAHNSPKLVILSGPADLMRAAVRTLTERRIAARTMPVPGAGHGARLATLGNRLADHLSGIRPQPSNVLLYSTVTGRPANGEALSAEYWGRNLCEPVLFSNAVDELIRGGHDIFVEVSRHPLLTGAISECLTDVNQRGTVLGSLSRDSDESATLLGSLGALYARGKSIRWTALHQSDRRVVALPTCCWRRRRFWFGDGAPTRTMVQGSHAEGEAMGHPRLGRHIRSAASPDTQFWQTDVDVQRWPSLSDYKLEGLSLIPPAFFVDLFLAAADEALPGATTLEDVELLKPLFLPRSGARQLQVMLVRRGAHEAEASIYDVSEAHTGGELRPPLVARSRIRVEPEAAGMPAIPHEPLEQIRERCAHLVRGADLYRRLAQGGLELGPRFQSLDELCLGSADVVARLRRPSQHADRDAGVGMETLQAAFTAATAAVPGEGVDLYWPTRIARVERGREPSNDRDLWASATQATPQDASHRRADVSIGDERGKLCLALHGVVSERLSRHMQSAGLLEWIYEIDWAPSERPTPLPAEPGCWIVLCDSQDVGETLGSLLETAGHSVIRVCRGPLEKGRSAHDRRVSASTRDDFIELLQRAAAEGPEIRGVVHLWALDSADSSELTADTLDQAQTIGCGSALSVVQALTGRSGDSHPVLWLVTQGAQRIRDGGAPTAIAQAPLWGFGRTVAGEQQRIWGGLIDLDPSASVAERAEQLRDELTAADAEDQIAYRSGQRYLARLRRMDTTMLRPDQAVTWRTDGVYLVSGGLGDLGLLVARWMAQRGARRLVLLGRTGLPSREAWDAIEPGSAQWQQVEAVRAIESLGATVRVAAVDVADTAAMTALLASLRESFGPVRGVMHLAGVIHGAALNEMDASTLEADLRPKVLGSWVLHSLLEGEPLDFFVLFSSGAAVMSSPLLSAYAAGNSFLDALADYRRSLGQHALSIDWGFWEETGAAARQLRELGRELNPRGMLGFTNDQGLTMLERLLGQDLPQAVVMHYNWKEWSHFHAAAAASPFLRELFATPLDAKAAPAVSIVPDRLHEALLAASPEATRDRLQRYLCERAAAALGRAPHEIDPDLPLTQMGIDSLMALEIKNRIELETGVVIPVAQFLQGPTIAQLGTLLLGQLQTQADGTRSAANRTVVQDLEELSSAPEDASALLEQLDELTPEQVDAALRSMGMVD